MSSQIEEIGLRLRADGVVETSKGLQLAADGVRQLGREATAANAPLKGLGISAGQTQQAMRQLPAQITDVVTSLASGMPVWMVAIQQGGQIKDSFGGIVPAGRALLGLLNPLTLAVGGLAAVGGSLVLAYHQGSEEQDAFARSIIMTGNAAGTTVSQMVAMAQGIDAVVGTQAQASDALAKIASGGQVAGTNLQKFGEVAVRMERVAGQSVEQTAKAFTELGRAPLQASLKLNEGTNYLTESVYRQIRALEDRGRKEEAASLAQNTYADAMKQRTSELESRLGTLEKAWNGVGGAAKEAWDWMLGIGRQETVQDKIGAVQDEIRKSEQRLKDAKNSPVKVAGLGVEQRELDLLKQRLGYLREEERMEVRSAENKAAAAAKAKAAIAAAEEARRKAASAGDKDLAERIALFQRIYGGTAPGAVSADDQRREFRQSEIRGEPAMNKFLQEQAADATAARAKALQATATAAERDATAMERELATLANHTAEIGLNEAGLLARRQALIDQQIGEAAAMLSVIEGAAGYEQQTTALYRQIDALQKMKGLQQDAFVKTSDEKDRKDADRIAKDEATANQRRSDGIADSIETGVMNGFRDSKSLADIFLNELKAQFARTVLRPMIQPIANALGGGGGGPSLWSLLGLAGGGGLATAGNAASIDAAAGLAAGWYHSGGTTGEPTRTGMLPASTWARAPRFHTGIGPDEIPAVIQRKEGVFTEGQMRAMAPVSEMAKAAGTTIHYAPTFNVGDGADKAQLVALMTQVSKQSQAELLDMMDRRMA